MFEIILSDYWADSAASLFSKNIIPESFSGIIMYLLKDTAQGPLIFNLLVFLGFLTTWTISFLISKKEFKNALTAIFFATIIAFAPLRIRYSMEWPTLVSWGFCVASIYISYKYIVESKINYALFAGLFFCIAFTEHPYLGAILALVMSISTLIFLLITRNKKYLTNSLVLLLIMMVFAIPGTYNVLKTRPSTGEDLNYLNRTRSEADRWAYSAKPWNYFIPDIDNPVLGDTAVKINYWIWNQKPYYLTEPYFPKEHSLYIGITLFILSLLTIYWTFISKKEEFTPYKDITLYFMIIGIVAFIYSMPPYVAYNNFKFYFPSQLLFEWMPQFRAYARFGVLVFIANAFLASISFNYIIQSKINTNLRYLIISIIIIFTILELSTTYFSKGISYEPTTPYKWMASQGQFTHLEIPKRTDYTDTLYSAYYKRPLINKYLHTSSEVQEIEDSITLNTGDPKELICNRFINELNGKYIVYHTENNIKQSLVEDFVKTGQVSQGLKIALSESWGQPIWGNHVPKTEKDIQELLDKKNMLDKLKNDPRLKQVAEFKQGELDSDKHFNTNDLDAVTIFEINPDYCK